MAYYSTANYVKEEPPCKTGVSFVPDSGLNAKSSVDRTWPCLNISNFFSIHFSEHFCASCLSTHCSRQQRRDACALTIAVVRTIHNRQKTCALAPTLSPHLKESSSLSIKIYLCLIKHHSQKLQIAVTEDQNLPNTKIVASENVMRRNVT
jgi:hypothetical protein